MRSWLSTSSWTMELMLGRWRLQASKEAKRKYRRAVWNVNKGLATAKAPIEVTANDDQNSFKDTYCQTDTETAPNLGWCVVATCRQRSCQTFHSFLCRGSATRAYAVALSRPGTRLSGSTEPTTINSKQQLKYCDSVLYSMVAACRTHSTRDIYGAFSLWVLSTQLRMDIMWTTFTSP